MDNAPQLLDGALLTSITERGNGWFKTQYFLQNYHSMRTKAQRKFTKTSAKQTYTYIKKYSRFIANICANHTQKQWQIDERLY